MTEPTNTILIVDDDPLVREVLGDFLDANGYAFRDAAGGAEALAALADDPSIGVVLTDLSMPGMTGVDLVAAARSRVGRALQIAILTGNGRREDVDAARRHGVDEFLDKPLDFGRLRDVIRRMSASAETAGRDT